MGSEIYGSPYGGGAHRAIAVSKVNAPAIGLIVIGSLGIAWNLLSLGLYLFGATLTLPSMMGDQDAAQRALSMMHSGFGLLLAIVGLAASGLIIYGAMKMRALTGYGLAMAAAILAMVPGLACWWCCCGLPGLPIGIWAVIVLVDNNVKASFV